MEPASNYSIKPYTDSFLYSDDDKGKDIEEERIEEEMAIIIPGFQYHPSGNPIGDLETNPLNMQGLAEYILEFASPEDFAELSSTCRKYEKIGFNSYWKKQCKERNFSIPPNGKSWKDHYIVSDIQAIKERLGEVLAETSGVLLCLTGELITLYALKSMEDSYLNEPLEPFINGSLALYKKTLYENCYTLLTPSNLNLLDVLWLKYLTVSEKRADFINTHMFPVGLDLGGVLMVCMSSLCLSPSFISALLSFLSGSIRDVQCLSTPTSQWITAHDNYVLRALKIGPLETATFFFIFRTQVTLWKTITSPACRKLIADKVYQVHLKSKKVINVVKIVDIVFGVPCDLVKGIFIGIGLLQKRAFF